MALLALFLDDYELKQDTRDFMEIYKITKLRTKMYSSY